MNIVLSLGFILVWVLAIGGWIANIYKLCIVTLPIAEFTILEVLRVVGIFVAPLGIVLGYF